jgi:mRNA-degrading endonuclease RelE of RelBE toxin-antitoxin system
MNWHIRWSKSAIKDMQKLDKPLRKRTWDSINSLAEQPLES